MDLSEANFRAKIIETKIICILGFVCLLAALQLAENNRDIVTGFICQKRCANMPGFLYWTAGNSKQLFLL